MVENIQSKDIEIIPFMLNFIGKLNRTVNLKDEIII